MLAKQQGPSYTGTKIGCRRFLATPALGPLGSTVEMTAASETKPLLHRPAGSAEDSHGNELEASEPV